MRLSSKARFLVTMLAALAVVMTPALLLAHARLVKSTPAANEKLTVVPRALSLWFSERPEARFTAIELVDSAGVAVAVGPVAGIPGDQMGMTVSITGALPNGRYTVRWRTAAADGHPTTGRYTFEISASVAPAPAVTPPPVVSDTTIRSGTTMPNAVFEQAESSGFSTSIRWAELVAVLVLVGVTIFRLFVLPEGALSADIAADASDRARRLAHAVLVLFIITALWRLSAQTDLLATIKSRGTAMMMVSRETQWGRGWLIGAAGAVIAGAGLVVSRGSRSGWIVAALGVVAICFSQGFTGHSGVLRQRASLAMAVDVAHLLGAGGWLGGLVAVLLCGLPATRRLEGLEQRRTGQRLVRSYHKAAVECVALVLITAIIAAWIRLSSPADLWTTPYGRILLMKVALAVILLVFGWYHWRAVVTPDWNDDTRFRFARSAAGELVVGAVLVGVTALLVSTALPQL